MNNRFKRGGVSMFLVVVTSMLVSLLVASFIRSVNRDIQSATNQDLSQSAYDSAQAGVEDAKRALVKYYQTCVNSSNANCSNILTQLTTNLQDQSCNVLGQTLGVGSASGETLIRTTSGDTDLSQAYTCLKMNITSPDFLGEVESGSSKLVRLNSAGSFNKVRVSWFNSKNANGATNLSLMSTTEAAANGMPLLTQNGQWKNSGNPRPSVLKVQLVAETGQNAEIRDYNYSNPVQEDKDGSKFLMLYPVKTGAGSVPSTSDIYFPGIRHNYSPNVVQYVQCKENFSSTTYACEATLSVSGNAAQGAFLRISSIYNGKTDFKVQLLNNDAVVNFFGTQPVVDSTGRANDKFRRIEARLDTDGINSSYYIPEYAVATEGKICKDMIIRDGTYDPKSSTSNCE